MVQTTKRGCNNFDTIRIGQTPEIQKAILAHLHLTQAKPLPLATRNDWYMATAYAVRDQMVNNWFTSFYDLISSAKEHLKAVSYLSSEFLMGPHLGNNLVNLGLTEPVRMALAGLGQELEDILLQEV